MIFHWKFPARSSKVRSQTLIEHIKFGEIIHGLQLKGRRPSYITISRYEMSHSNMTKQDSEKYTAQLVKCLHDSSAVNIFISVL